MNQPRFGKGFDPLPGVLEDVGPGIRRIVAANPGPYTFRGTGTYVIGRGEVAVIDPGPADERHIAALTRQLRGETITHVLVTHTHPDHSPGCAPLRVHTEAPTYGYGPHPIDPDDDPGPSSPEASGDLGFRPDLTLAHGDIVTGPGWTAEALHTPGHISNHLCFRVRLTKGNANRHERILFTGDHVMGWSTSVISPPHGDLRAYLSSLELLLTEDDARYWPTHGTTITNPHDFVRALIDHRHERTRQIVEALAVAPRTVAQIVERLYVGLDPRLVGAAGRSVLAHLVELERQGNVDVRPETTGEATDATADPADQPITAERQYQLVGERGPSGGSGGR
jgi:glyoxylase-like metal-dependent hydrolase (beta-lactamase superfamily II)